MDFNPGLMQQLLEQDLGVQMDTLRNFKAKALTKSLLKKLAPCDKMRLRDMHAEAVEHFMSVNKRAQNVQLTDHFLDSELFITWKSLLELSFNGGIDQEPAATLWSSKANGMCGPGASVGADDGTFFTKMFDSHISTTSLSLFQHYQLTPMSKRWREAENFRSSGSPYDCRLVRGSQLGTASKSSDKLRTTTTEPILNMFYQLGLKSDLDRVLLQSFGIDLSLQQKRNRRLARSGSLTGLLATLDLKDASDLITVLLCRVLLPRNLFRLLMKIRSPEVLIQSYKYRREGVTFQTKERYEELHMMATMGNGFCFSLMTLIFASLVKAIHIVNGVPYNPRETSGVYGDDIIILSSLAPQLRAALSSAGLVVNEEKSFVEGPFRESCGGDYYLGHDVRGVYIKRMTNEAHCYSAFNRLQYWSIRHGFDLSGTLCYLRSLAEFRPVPFDEGFTSGFHVPESYLRVRKFTKEKQIVGGRNAYPAERLTNPRGNENGGVVYHCLSPIRNERLAVGDRFRNTSGGLISFLGGYVRGDKILLRCESKNLQYRVVRKSTTSWNWIPHPGIEYRDVVSCWYRLDLFRSSC